MSTLPRNRVDVDSHGHWTVLVNSANGVSHLSWQWHGGMTLGYLCCMEMEWFDDVKVPPPDLNVSCITCMGTIL